MIALIVAYSKNHVIGNKGRIPWKIKGEQLRFKELTTNNAVIMGRKSYEEIGTPLPNRMNIVVSNSVNKEIPGVILASSLQDAIEKAVDYDVFISGGARLYEEAISLVDKMFVTEIDLELEGDTYFPYFDESKWEKVVEKEVKGEIPYRYVTYTLLR